MKKTTAALITMAALAPTAHADLYVFERQPNQPTAIHHGLANGIPVLIDIYGRDSIESAREYGRGLVRHHHPFAESKALIIAEAQRRYANQQQLANWFERDAALGFDQQITRER